MRTSILCAVVSLLAAQTCYAGLLEEKMQELGAQFQQTGENIKTDVINVHNALVEHTKNRFMELLKESGSALIGAFVQSMDGFDLASILGKRDLKDSVNAITEWLEDNKAEVERIFRENKERITDVINEIATGKFDMADLEDKLRQINEKHEMDVRSVLSDTLNTGIDWIKALWSKLTNSADPEVAEPVMLRRRSLADILAKFTETLKPHLDNVVQITKDITSTLAHHAGNMWEQHKNAAIDKVNEMLSGIHESLTKLLPGQQNAITGDEEVVAY